MRIKAIFVFGFLIVLFSLPVHSFACSYVIRPPVINSPSEFIFIGEVVDIIGPLLESDLTLDSTNWTLSDHNRAKILADNCYGLLIKVIDVVSLPDSLIEFVELYPYGYTASCAPHPWNKEELTKPYRYPIGSQIRVIAKPTKYFNKYSPTGLIRLESWVFNGGCVARNEPSNYFFVSPPLPISYKPKKDIKLLKKLGLINKKDGFPKRGYFDLKRFEYRKDLVRLNNAKNIKQKIEILKRLQDFDLLRKKQYSELVKMNIDDEKTVNKLIKQRNRKN